LLGQAPGPPGTPLVGLAGVPSDAKRARIMGPEAGSDPRLVTHGGNAAVAVPPSLPPAHHDPRAAVAASDPRSGASHAGAASSDPRSGVSHAGAAASDPRSASGPSGASHAGADPRSTGNSDPRAAGSTAIDPLMPMPPLLTGGLPPPPMAVPAPSDDYDPAAALGSS